MKSDILKVLGAFLLLIIVFLVGTVSTVSVMGRDSAQVVADKSIVDLSLLSYGIKWTPDGHISYVSFPDGKSRYFISGNQSGYAIESKRGISLEATIKSNPVIKKVYGPEAGSDYKNNYSTIAQVLQIEQNNPYHLFALTQNEQQVLKQDGTYDFANFTASISLLESYDGGLTWNDFGPVIRGDDYIAPGTRISGAGEPSAVIKDGYIYIYYVDWAAQTKVFHGDYIYLARTHIEPNGGLTSLEFYTSSGFSTVEENLQPVVIPTIGNSNYASLPSVSYNKYTRTLFMVFETNDGFHSVTSFDGLNWNNEKVVFTFPQPQSEKKEGNTWYSYPTFLSDTNEASDQTTDKKGNLYFSKGTWPNVAHQLAKQSIIIR